MKRVIVVGAGGHGRAVAEILLLRDEYRVAGFVDDAVPAQTLIWKLPVLGRIAELPGFRSQASMAIVAIGNNSTRQLLTDEVRAAQLELITVVHPSAIVSPSARIGAGCAIMAGAIIGTEAWLGEGAIVNAGAVVDHHCHVDDFGHLGVGACMAGGSILGAKAWMQAGSAIGYGAKIEDGVVLRPGEAM